MGAAAPGRRERKKKALRARIVTDCCTLIADIGVDGTTLEALCDQVDISKKTFYNYFDSKDSLLLEICQSHLVAGIAAALDTAMAEGGDCAAQLDLVFTALAEGQAEPQRFDVELIDYLVSNFVRNRGASVGLLDEMNAHFTRFFDHHRESLRQGYSPQFCGEMVVGMIVSVALNWINHPEATSAQALPQLCAFIQQSMLTAPAGEAA
ncbi:MAG: TetR/AcrR family transcriptional regulator [Halioglobus sp.]|nr:TetR/AcrR family transcriptional regulator [Halioglobus sp.]